MDSTTNNSERSIIESHTTQKKEIKKFIYVMVVFTIGMAFLIFFEVSAWWIWYIFFALWTLIEYRIAKNIKLRWWHWMLIIVAIILTDLLVLELVAYVKK